MHHHGYLWVGAKERFDQEALRRPPYPEPPPTGSKPELIQRYREVAAEFPTVDLPPLETAYWLVKPRPLIRGTWGEAKEAADWIGARVAEYAPRFSSDRDGNFTDVALLINYTTGKLSSGADVSLGFYLERPSYLSLAVVTCSPNRTKPELLCPDEQGETV
ncbi:hypothetical protein [Streptomyces griseochromogenes]|uniref:hypothetical protein n=1 Tax=Streptomyces griseochromogenes TaxID=68214 RepID=UPI0037997363